MVLQSINSYDLQNHIIEEPPIHLDQVKAFEPKTTVESLPILQARDYPDGIYQNFTEFKENRTTIWDGYEVDDSRELKLDWADSLGEDYKPPIYAIAYHNQLYYHYNNNFYPIEKRGNTFIFFGPERSNPHQVVRDWFWGGVVVAAVGTASQNLRLVYEIDLHTGGIRELGYSRR